MQPELLIAVQFEPSNKATRVKPEMTQNVTQLSLICHLFAAVFRAAQIIGYTHLPLTTFLSVPLQEAIVRFSRFILATYLAFLMSLAVTGQTQAPQRIDIVAKKYAFEPETISLKKGVPVILVFRSADVTHGIKVKELGVSAEIPKGQSVEVPLTPQVAGTFEGKCSHFCGIGHGRMKITFHVTE